MAAVVVLGIAEEEGTVIAVITAVTVATKADIQSGLIGSSVCWGFIGSSGSCGYSGRSGY